MKTQLLVGIIIALYSLVANQFSAATNPIQYKSKKYDEAKPSSSFLNQLNSNYVKLLEPFEQRKQHILLKLRINSELERISQRINKMYQIQSLMNQLEQKNVANEQENSSTDLSINNKKEKRRTFFVGK
jgi:hypothetical protein